MTTGTSRPAALATASPLAFAIDLPGPLPQQNALTVPRDIRAELSAARRVGDVANEGFATVAHGLSGYTLTPMQKARKRLDSDTLWGSGIAVIIAGVAGGFGIASGIPHFGFGSETQGIWAGWAVFGGACLVEGAVLAVSNVARKVSSKQERRRIDTSDIDAVVKELETGTDFERAVGGRQLAKWQNALDRRQVLTPEARMRLADAEAALRPSDKVAAERVATLREIADLIDGRDTLSSYNVIELAGHIGKLDQADQHAVATIAAETIRNSSRTKEYSAEHEAHALPRKFPAITSAPKDD